LRRELGNGKQLEENSMSTAMTLDEKRDKAANIVHAFALAHAGIAFTLANTAIGDTVVLTALTLWMIQKIGGIYGCNDINPWQVIGRVFGWMAGTYIGAKLLFFIPFLGNLANAVATSVVTETIGWTCIFLMESFDDPSKVSEDEWEGIVNQARKRADADRKENKILLKKMTKEEKNRYKEIGELIRKGDLTEEQEKSLLKEMNDIRQRILAR
jgi:uncharacterized protein (DUF697 family)